MSEKPANQGNKVKGYISVLLSDQPEGQRIYPKRVLKQDLSGLKDYPMKFPYSEVDTVLEFYDMFAEEFGKLLRPDFRGLRSGDWLQMNTFTQDKSGKTDKVIQYGYIGKWQNNIVLAPHCDVICHSAKHANALFFLKVKEGEV
jgi:hypothetical protein